VNITTMKNHALRNVLLLLITAAVAACGGGSDGSGGSSPPPAKISVPNVVGDTQAAATAAITGAGLTVGTVTKATSATVASGSVISESPAAGTSVASGAAVALTVSTGAQTPTHTVGGTLIGLAGSATVHILNGADNVPISQNGSFTLPTGVAVGGTYSVTVGTPTSAQSCAVQNGSGTVGSANIANVVVYCTYTVADTTLSGTYISALAYFASPESGSLVPVDSSITAAYSGAGAYTGTATVNNGGTIVPGVAVSGTYAVSTTNAIPSLTVGTSGSGGIEGVNGDASITVDMTSGTAPSVGIGVVPNATATTASINGNYTLVDLSAQLSSGNIYGYDATITLTNGIISGTYTENNGGTITTGNPAGGQWSVTNGVVTSVGSSTGAVSADGDLIVLADTNSGDDPYINVAVLRGSGVTPATFEGVYSVVEYGGTPLASTFGKSITLFAYGNGTYSVIYAKNANGTITTNNTDTGTYTVAADGTLELIDSEGDVYDGAISADGNALALSSVASQQNPAIFAGVRQ
jgi:hypothetical protein